MKKNYILPSTTAVSFHTEYICQTNVTSVQGDSGLHYGGSGSGSGSPIDPV